MNCLKVNIIPTDIQLGFKKSATYCPIALAIKRELSQHRSLNPYTETLEPAKDYYVSVSTSEVTISGDGLTHVYTLPLVARNFVSSFDNEKPVQPFQFNIYIDRKY